MGNKNKAKGTSFEVLVRDYLRERGFIHAHRPALSGGKDTGDVNGVIQRETLSEVAVQCKNQKSFKLSEWLDATVEQAKNLREGLPILVVKRAGKGAKALGDSYVVMRLDDVIRLLSDADYS
jgi:hypothetical protein